MVQEDVVEEDKVTVILCQEVVYYGGIENKFLMESLNHNNVYKYGQSETLYNLLNDSDIQIMHVKY